MSVTGSYNRFNVRVKVSCRQSVLRTRGNSGAIRIAALPFYLIAVTEPQPSTIIDGKDAGDSFVSGDSRL